MTGGLLRRRGVTVRPQVNARLKAIPIKVALGRAVRSLPMPVPPTSATLR
jgi:hypothetical protein